MGIKKKYSAPLQIVETPEMRARIIAISDAEDVSQADVLRDIIAHGIEWREQISAERTA